MAASHMRPRVPARVPLLAFARRVRPVAAFCFLSVTVATSLHQPSRVLQSLRSHNPDVLSQRNAVAKDQPGWGRRTSEGSRLSLRGGFDEIDPFKHVTTMAEAQEAAKKVKTFDDEVDNDLLAGDIFRMSTGFQMAEEQHERLQDQFDDASVQFHLTQQFLILQRERIKSLMPGGSNCTYADSWMTGQLWDRADDEFRWTRSAWIQAKRAQSWDEMPAVWKKIMTNQWIEFQEFLAMVSLPDAGVNSERYKEHVKAWEVMQSGYMNNLNRAMAEMQSGKLQEEVDAEAAEAKELFDARSAEPRVNTLFEWVQKKAEQAVRKMTNTETEEDLMEDHSPVEVHLFGITLFNTKDPISERLWSFGSSQGETMTAWPLKCLSWVAKKGERLGVLPYPAPAPTISGVHVLLNSTRYQKDYDSGAVDRRRFNALEHIHGYINNKLGMEYNASAWERVREPHDVEEAAGEEGELLSHIPIMEPRSWKALFAKLRGELERLVLGPQEAEEEKAGAEGAEDEGDELIAKLSPVDITNPRKDIGQVFRNGGGGELRLVARALNLTIPNTQREWLDDPMADEGVMRELLIHPRIQKALNDPMELEPLTFIPIG